MKMKAVGEICLVAVVGLFTSCASGYKAIHPPIVSYSNESVTDSIAFSYKYDVLWDSRNKKYAKKEAKRNIKVLAVKIVNNSGKTIVFNRNIRLYSNDKLIAPVDKDSLYEEFRQPAAAYILYLLLTPIHKMSVNFNGPSNIFPFGYIVGPVLAAGNILVASRANTNFKYELEKYNLLNREIPPGDTVYGLIGIEVNENLPLTMKVERIK